MGPTRRDGIFEGTFRSLAEHHLYGTPKPMTNRAPRFSALRQGPTVFEDHFDGPTLDRSKWLPAYLPHWTTPEAAQARYEMRGRFLRLLIEDDQPPWLPDLEGGLKVSNLQTGHFSGPLGSPHGQHRSRAGLVVRTELPQTRLFVPTYCQLEMRARVRVNPWNLAGLWLIGFEDEPERSGEITVFEAFGYNVDTHTARIGRGIKSINDPSLTDELDEGELTIAVEDWHDYAMDWSASGVEFYVDDQLVTRTDQSPDYPMQLMLNLYDLPSEHDRSNAADPWFDVDFIRAFAA